MRRACFFVFTLLFLLSPGGGGTAFAFAEPAIQTEVVTTKNQTTADLNAAVSSYTCGGLLNPVDTRVLAYYSRKPSFECILTEWCDKYHNTTGDCIGQKCILKDWDQKGIPQATLLQDCTGGSCVDPPPHRACSFTYFASRARHYECGRWAGMNFATQARADCYTYAPFLHYENWYYPFAYNCVLDYLGGGTPVHPDDPKGKPLLIPPHTSRPFSRESRQVWEPAQGSNLTVPSLPDPRLAVDSSASPLTLDRATLYTELQVMHPTTGVPTRVQDYPDLSGVVGKLMNPPEVRLILPRGALSLAHDRSNLFVQVFESLQSSASPRPLVRTLGNNPDALLLAAEYLESIPLMETRYEEVEVLAPYASATTLKELAEEWRTWLAYTEDLAAEAGLSVDSTVVATVQDNIDVLHSYLALQDSIREYRLHFPRYLNALLTYVEASNRFFQEQWAAANAQRLRDWHTAYLTYLPNLRNQLRALYDLGAHYTKNCLVPACRLDAIPVAGSVKPWTLVPPGSDLAFSGMEQGAFLPEGPRLWENYRDQVLEWHPPRTIGMPLPDLTLDFSEVYLKRAVTVPILKILWQPLALPYPPEISGENIARSLESLQGSIKPLPRLHPPLPRLTFPVIKLPDPSNLLLVPEAPKALDVWSQALTWKATRLNQLLSTCDSSPNPQTFLVHEYMLSQGKRNPAAVRATSYVPWRGAWQYFSHFLPLNWDQWFWPYTYAYYYSPYSYYSYSYYYPYYYYPYSYPYSYPSIYPYYSYWGFWGRWIAPLIAPSHCSNCTMVRPQRYLRQHIELDLEWEALQENFLRALDEWNAQVRYFSVIPRDELESISTPR